MTDIIDSDNPEDDGEEGNGNDSGDGSGNGIGKGKARRNGGGEKPAYEVGYGKPPRQHQFPKGQSGNPRGPRKGSHGIKTDLHNALSAKHSIRVDGRIVKGTTQELALLTLAKRAATGDVRASHQLIELTIRVFGVEDRGRERNTLSAHDRELLDRMLDRLEESEPEGDNPKGGARPAGGAGGGSDTDADDHANGGDNDDSGGADDRGEKL